MYISLNNKRTPNGRKHLCVAVDDCLKEYISKRSPFFTEKYGVTVYDWDRREGKPCQAPLLNIVLYKLGLRITAGQEIIFKNGMNLDWREENLCPVIGDIKTHLSHLGRLGKWPKSEFTGVYAGNKDGTLWYSIIGGGDHKFMSVSVCSSEIEAAQSYDQMAKIRHKIPKLNFKQPKP